jgi:hypothetical protein
VLDLAWRRLGPIGGSGLFRQVAEAVDALDMAHEAISTITEDVDKNAVVRAAIARLQLEAGDRVAALATRREAGTSARDIRTLGDGSNDHPSRTREDDLLTAAQ